MPVILILTLGLMLPVSTRMTWTYIFERLRFGTARFDPAIKLGPLYGALLASGIIMMGVGLIIASWLDPSSRHLPFSRQRT